MVLAELSLQFVQVGEAAHLIQWRYLSRPMCPEWSWNIREAWVCKKLVTSFSQFFEGVDLLIEWVLWYCGNNFHLCFHLFCTLVYKSCLIAAMPIGNECLSNFDRLMLGLDSPFAAPLANSSAFLFSAKFLWPEIHWTLRLMTPLVLTINWFPWCLALWKSAAFNSLSCFTCKLLARLSKHDQACIVKV